MLTRLTHAAIAFAAMAALYQVYYLAVVPFVEPPSTLAQATAAAADKVFEASADALDKHRELLAAYFPPDHWCFAKPPKMLENGQVLVVFDEYTQSTTGVLTAPRCAMVFFPGGLKRGAMPPRDAVVLESEFGAALQMEQVLDRGVNGFGRFQHGQLKGVVTIRSDMREPGPHDDLLIKTRELYMNENLIRTDQPVDIRLGEHHGFGRELEIRRLKTETALSAGAVFGSFEDLVIKHDVSFSMTPRSTKTLGKTAAANAEEVPGAPIHIRSVGPFRIDFGSYRATFEEQVRAWQLHEGGKMDELLATKLTLFFTKATRWNADADAAPAGAGILGDASMTFEPASLEALGTPEAPVLLKAPSQDASATGQRLWIEMAGRSISRITLEAGEEVVLRHQGAEIHARTLQYQLPRAGSGQTLGTMSARGGGWMRSLVDPARPHEILEVSWTDAMQLVRRADGQPVLVLDGRPKVSLIGMGTLWADQLQLFLREQPVNASRPSSLKNAVSLTSSVMPELIKATGRVGIQSTALNGKVNQLDIKIEQQAAAQPEGSAVNASGAAAAPSPFALGRNSPQRAYNITGVKLQLDVVMRDRQADVRAIRVDGGVVFEESMAAGAPGPPLRIVAEHLNVTGADTPNARIEILGGGGQNGVPLQNAEITAGGAEIKAPALTLNRGASEAVINSPGTLKLMVDRDLTGNPLPVPQPLDINWQQSMKLQGRRITFLGDVHVANASGWLRTRRLVAQMTNDIRFDGAGAQGPPQLEQLECWEGAVAEFEQHDISGLTSRQHVELQSLTANQITGALGGMGPGSIDSVHLSKNTAALLALPQNAGAPAPQLVQTEPELRHLHIDFVREVDGNLHTSSVRVHGDVQAVYGPVENWDKRLAMSPGGNPGPGAVWITSDILGVTEDPAAKLAKAPTRQFELEALGHVTIEGQDPRQGAFTAYGHRSTYNQSKGLFILEGDGVTPATIEQQQSPGGIGSPQSAQRMIFNHNTGSVRVEGLHKGQFNQIQTPQQSRQPEASPFR
jgi:hypothetical protein